MKQHVMDAVIKGNRPQQEMPQEWNDLPEAITYVQFKKEAHPDEKIPSVDPIQDVNITRQVQKRATSAESASASSGVSQSWMLGSSCGILNLSFEHKRMQRELKNYLRMQQNYKSQLSERETQCEAAAVALILGMSINNCRDP